MKIRVIKSKNPNCWYNECIGEVFHVYVIPNSQVLHFTHQMYFYPEDVELVREGIGYLPSFTSGTA